MKETCLNDQTQKMKKLHRSLVLRDHADQSTEMCGITSEPQNPFLPAPQLISGHLEQGNDAWVTKVLNTDEKPFGRLPLADEHRDVSFRSSVLFGALDQSLVQWELLRLPSSCHISRFWMLVDVSFQPALLV